MILLFIGLGMWGAALILGVAMVVVHFQYGRDKPDKVLLFLANAEDAIEVFLTLGTAAVFVGGILAIAVGV